MDRPRLYVDFNEMLEPDLVLLSRGDTKVDSAGTTHTLAAGMVVEVYMDDVDDFGRPDPLVATGTVEATPEDTWAKGVRWSCRLGPEGIRHLSDLSPP